MKGLNANWDENIFFLHLISRSNSTVYIQLEKFSGDGENPSFSVYFLIGMRFRSIFISRWKRFFFWLIFQWIAGGRLEYVIQAVSISLLSYLLQISNKKHHV